MQFLLLLVLLAAVLSQAALLEREESAGPGDVALKCKICQESVNLVERVVLYNATGERESITKLPNTHIFTHKTHPYISASSGFQDAASQLCSYLPDNMKPVVRTNEMLESSKRSKTTDSPSPTHPTYILVPTSLP